MRLLIIRHAIAVERGTAGVADEERPLTRKGIRRFRAAARGLAALLPRPDMLFTSPLLRARQTARIAARAWGGPDPVEAVALAGGEFEEVAETLGGFPEEALVAIVGHEPQLSEMLARLLGGAEPGRLVFKKGGVALLNVPGRLEDGGALLFFVPPRLLRRIRTS
jgi:phosphohistidine phosphatase